MSESIFRRLRRARLSGKGAKSRKPPDDFAEHRRNERLVSRSTLAMAWLTALLTIAAAVNLVVSALQWKSVQGQLDEMRDDSRAWLSVKTALSGDLVINPFYLTVQTTTNVVNVGKRPAMDVEVITASELVASPHFLTAEIRQPIADEVLLPAKGCAKNDPVEAESSTGLWVPPGESFSHAQQQFAIVNGPTVQDEIANNDFALVINGCVKYRSGDKPEIHVTTFHYTITNKISEDEATFFKHATTNMMLIYKIGEMQIKPDDERVRPY